MIGDPIVIVTCDKCKVTYEYGLTELAGGGWDDRNLEKDMRRDSWTSKNGEDLCYDCSREAEQGE